MIAVIFNPTARGDKATAFRARLTIATRAAQASGARDDASEIYRICVAGAKRSVAYATASVGGFLATVGTLCAGRASGRYAVDEPDRLDADPGSSFKPLTLPRK